MNDLDAAKAAELVKKHAVALHGNLANYSFKLISVAPNTENDVWKVTCEYLVTATDTTPVKYLFRVNVSHGQILDITKLD
ncbi:MAG: hypothetical protein AABW54_00075 [Candidatus Micrarchaeota archaeon]